MGYDEGIKLWEQCNEGESMQRAKIYLWRQGNSGTCVYKVFACTGNSDCGVQRHSPMIPWIIKQFFSWGRWIDVKWCNVWHVLFWRLCLHQLHRCDGRGTFSIQVPWLLQLGHPWVYTRSGSVLLRKAPRLIEHHPVLPQQQHLGYPQLILRNLKQTQPCALSLSMHIAATTYWS